MPRPLRFVVLATLWALSSTPALADTLSEPGTAPNPASPPIPLTLDSALRLAQARSLQLPAQDAAATAARQAAVAAGQRPDPVLRAGNNNLPVTGPDRFSVARDFMTMRSVGVAQEFTRAAKLKARSARFEREADVAQAGRDLALAGLRRDTALAWLERHFQQRMLGLLSAQRDEARLLIDAADSAYRSGRGAQADVFAARQSVAQWDDRLALVRRQLSTAITQLTRWVGPAGADALGDPPALDRAGLHALGLHPPGPQPQQPVAPDPDLQPLATQLAQHPQTLLLARREAVALADVELARANQQPDISAELMLSQRGSAYSQMVSLNLSLPWPWDRAQRQDRELAARLAVVEQLRAEREEADRGHLAEALAMLQAWQGERERLALHDQVLLPLAAERTRAALAAYRGGSTALATVLDARRSEIDARMDRLRIEMDAARGWAQIQYLLPPGPDGALADRPAMPGVVPTGVPTVVPTVVPTAALIASPTPKESPQ